MQRSGDITRVAPINVASAAQRAGNVTGVTQVNHFVRAGEDDRRGHQGRGHEGAARVRPAPERPKARSDGVSVSGLRAAPGLGLSSDSSPPPAVMGPGVGPFRVEIESELHR